METNQKTEHDGSKGMYPTFDSIRIPSLTPYLSKFISLEDDITPLAASHLVEKHCRIFAQVAGLKPPDAPKTIPIYSTTDITRTNPLAIAAVKQQQRYKSLKFQRKELMSNRHRLIMEDVRRKFPELFKEELLVATQQQRMKLAKTVGRLVLEYWALAKKIVDAKVAQKEAEIARKQEQARLDAFLHHSTQTLAKQQEGDVSMSVTPSNVDALSEESFSDDGSAGNMIKEEAQDEHEDHLDASLLADEFNQATSAFLSSGFDATTPLVQIGSTAVDSNVNVHVKIPFLLKFPLRPYQISGLDWLVRLFDSGTNGILADEMVLLHLMKRNNI